MARKFFDQLIVSGTKEKTKRKLTLPVSIGIHVVVLASIIVLPLLTPADLPEPAYGAVKAFFVEAAPPPPPPPPAAPQASKPRPVTETKVEQPRVVPQVTPKFVAPVEQEIPEVVADSGVSEGVPEGVAGGVPEGVVGGVEGGVVGGVEGGVEGGVVGGEVGGTGTGEGEPAEPEKPAGPVRVGGRIKAPQKLKDVAPRYSDLAKAARVSGIVILECVISPEGRVTNVKVLRGAPLLDREAVEAVKQWVYSPTLLNGDPVAVIMTVTVNFKIQ